MTERELIRIVRVEIERTKCECDATLMNSELCGRCIILDIIDSGLRDIGQTNKEMMADDGYKTGAVLRDV